MIRLARYSGMSAAALVLAALLGGLFLMDRTSTVAFADVADVIKNVKQAKSVTLTSRQKFGNQPEFTFKWSMQGNAVRMEIPDQLIHIADLKKKKGLQINIPRKTAYEFPLEKPVAGAFANPVDQIRRVNAKDAERIGEERLDGRKTIVYRFEKIDFLGAKGKGRMKVWVDPKTKLPVRIRIGMNTRRGAKPQDRPFDTVMTLEDFEWNKSLDPKLFRLKVPDGYTVKQGRPGPRTP